MCDLFTEDFQGCMIRVRIVLIIIIKPRINCNTEYCDKSHTFHRFTLIVGYPGGSSYVSTKFAVEGLSESIAYELEPFGIKVVLIEPGFIKTNFANSLVIAKKAQDPSSPYSQMMQKWQQTQTKWQITALLLRLFQKLSWKPLQAKSQISDT